MTALYTSDTTLANLQQIVLRELREPTTGSEAIPLDLVTDAINQIYTEAFNDQRIKKSARQNTVSFNTAVTDQLSGAVLAGATSITINDASTFRSKGQLLLLSDIVSYTGKAGNTFTGVTGVDVDQEDGNIVRQLYPLADIASDIDEENVQYLDINGLPQQYMSYENLITSVNFYPNSYGVYKGNLVFSRQSSIGGGAVPGKALMIYTQKVVPMTSGTDKPTLIPNSFRIPILAYGACYRLAAADSYRMSWDFWKGEYDKALSQYIAFKNNRVSDINNKRRPSIYSPFSLR